ncbi:MAG: helix-turn-helix domain-containing protein [Prevotellaceae bacterium]|jgi:transcriptional regulator with XRE-family HTH domain|nr:helix-turn-helix domain-containing protein [Prevotellaceae bacterium]
MLFANKIRYLRENKHLLQRQLAAALEIDTPMYSKIERGDRRVKREQVITLANLLQVDSEELLTLWLADQVYSVVKGTKHVGKVLNIVQENIAEYGKK